MHAARFPATVGRGRRSRSPPDTEQGSTDYGLRITDLVPAYGGGSQFCADVVVHNEGFVIAEIPIRETRHHIAGKRVKVLARTDLRHADTVVGVAGVRVRRLEIALIVLAGEYYAALAIHHRRVGRAI